MREFGERPALARRRPRACGGPHARGPRPERLGQDDAPADPGRPAAPDRRQGLVLGSELPREAYKLRGRVGYLGHEPLLYRDLSPNENLRLAARLHGLDREGSTERIASLLHRVGMERRADDRVGEFSAGMAQRVAACRAVLHEPELLLLDEPDSHLDPDAREAVGDLLGPAEGRTRVVVSHERERALAGADDSLEL